MDNEFTDPSNKYDYNEETGVYSKKVPEQKKKLNILGWFDTPTCPTGFGQVAKNILKILHNTGDYNINILGINHGGDSYDTDKFPYRIDPATCLLSNDTDLHGRGRLIKKLRTEKVDILFIIQDTFLVMSIINDILKVRQELPLDRQFVIVYYFPIDGTPRPEWIENSVLKVDFPVVYTQYGKQACYKAVNKIFPLEVIYHGTNKQDFYPIEETAKKKFRDKVFGLNSNDFIIINVNRNQQRKDLHRSLGAYSIFHKKHPDSFYYINCQMEDIGGNIAVMGAQYGLRMPDTEKGLKGDWTFPTPGTFDIMTGFSVEVLNAIYNSADLVISSTLGEGWGLSCTEAMSCKVPVLFPRNTSLIEMIGENEERGYLCKSGEDEDHKICLGGIDMSSIRPVVNVNDMADKMSYIYEHREEAAEKALKAFDWAVSWEDLAPKWLEVFSKAESKLKEIRGELQK
jgi:glycosyltransferase involved in cell wall biosynthesis